MVDHVSEYTAPVDPAAQRQPVAATLHCNVEVESIGSNRLERSACIIRPACYCSLDGSGRRDLLRHEFDAREGMVI